MRTRRDWMIWVSGLLAAPAIVHAARALTGAAVSIEGWAVPLWISWAAAPVCGVAAWWFGRPRGAWESGAEGVLFEQELLENTDPAVFAQAATRLGRSSGAYCGMLVGLSEDVEVGHEDDEDV